MQVHGIDLSVNMINLALERSIDTPRDALVRGVWFREYLKRDTS